MSRNYSAIHYIQNQMKDFDPKFVDCVVRCFNMIDQTHEPDGCLSNSIALFICAKEYGYNPVLCYGLCELNQKEFYHAWLEIDNIVIDMSIYGNVNFSSYSLWDNKLDKPYIGSYEESATHYGKFEFDKNWRNAMIAKAEGLSFTQYINMAPNNAMWKLVCKILDKTPTQNLVKHLETHIKNNIIKRN